MSTNRRLNRIFRPSGRALIVAMDHGLLDGPCPGLEDPGQVISQIVAGGADAVLTSYGVARRFARELAPVGLILRADGDVTSLGAADAPPTMRHGVEDALRLGADAIALNGFPGTPYEAATLENIARVAGQAHAWGLPVMAEMVPGGFDSPPEWRTLENIALAVRLGAELGADFVKTPYAPGFEWVVDTCYVPVVILGGAKRGSEGEMLADIQSAVDAGASGVAIGRNIFQADNPAAMTAAVAAILHQGADVDEALALIETQ
ncbi:MAG: deoxyribose-phosphate aldolase [Anaerolineae bacterium]|jgi:DhnA family fructose-bisphosphate aldolase class Ia